MNNLYHISFHGMGCVINAQLQAEGGADLLQLLPQEVERLEQHLSRFRPHSELMQLNNRAGEWVTVSDILIENIHAAKNAARITDGLYNPLILPAMLANGYDRSFENVTQPAVQQAQPAPDWRDIKLRLKQRQVWIPKGSALDLGGIAKGWSAQYLAKRLAGEEGACLIDIGGDMYACGAPQKFAGWPVEVENPLDGAAVATISACDMAVVTSGVDYRRWQAQDGSMRHHIINPMTGASAETDALTVTIAHTEATLAEAYTKAVLILGSNAGLDWLTSRWQGAAFVIRQDGAVLATSDFISFISSSNFDGGN